MWENYDLCPGLLQGSRKTASPQKLRCSPIMIYMQQDSLGLVCTPPCVQTPHTHKHTHLYAIVPGMKSCFLRYRFSSGNTHAPIWACAGPSAHCVMTSVWPPLPVRPNWCKLADTISMLFPAHTCGRGFAAKQRVCIFFGIRI